MIKKGELSTTKSTTMSTANQFYSLAFLKELDQWVFEHVGLTATEPYSALGGIASKQRQARIP